MFCDSCEKFQMRLYGVEDAAYCKPCFEDLDPDSQGSLQDYRINSKTYVLIGWGGDKNDIAGMVSAHDLYSSAYFEKKLKFGDELGDEVSVIRGTDKIDHLDDLRMNLFTAENRSVVRIFSSR